MSRDYKNSTPRQKSSGKGQPFLSGLLIGLLLGVGISVVLAIFITGGKSPFENKVTPGAVIEADKNSPPPVEQQPAPAETEKSRFDFYDILPGNESEEAKVVPLPENPPAPAETYFLQVGAFQTEQEADNMKARLALQGMETIVQTVEVPDKGILHRVRVGPFSNMNEVELAREQLKQNDIAADLVRAGGASN